MWDERFQYDNHLRLTKAVIELSHMTSFIKYLLLIKMFMFINATKVHSFLLQPKKYFLHQLENRRCRGADKEGIEGAREEVSNPCHRKNCSLIFKKQIFLMSV